MSSSLNKATLIGNLTRDIELKKTQAGQSVCSFSIATNRAWKNANGDKQEDVQFHNIVAWGKLAEICAQYLSKGKKIYAEGRLQTRQWEDKEGGKRSTTEIIMDNMIMLTPGGKTTHHADMGGIETAPAEEEIDVSKIPF